MQVILLQKVENLGALGDKVTVKAGYGRNYLIPSGQAVAATEENLKAFEERRAELEHQAHEILVAAEARKSQLDGVTLTIGRKAGDEGRLFGSVGTTDIAEAARQAGYELEKSEIRLSEGPMRAVGEYEMQLRLHSDVECTIKVEVVPEA
jgi:large subunit ribosomal protein L9